MQQQMNYKSNSNTGSYKNQQGNQQATLYGKISGNPTDVTFNPQQTYGMQPLGYGSAAMYTYPPFLPPPYQYPPQSQFPPNYRASYGYQQATVSGAPYSAYHYPGHVSPTSFDEYSNQEFENSYQGRSSPHGQGLPDQPTSPANRQESTGSDASTDLHQSSHSGSNDGSTGHYGFGSNQATGSQIPMPLNQQPFSFLPHQHQQQMNTGNDTNTDPHQLPSHSIPSGSMNNDGSAGHYGFGSNQNTGSQIPMPLGQQQFSFVSPQQQQMLYQGHDRSYWP